MIELHEINTMFTKISGLSWNKCTQRRQADECTITIEKREFI